LGLEVFHDVKWLVLKFHFLRRKDE
jgi:hypothetical protein